VAFLGIALIIFAAVMTYYRQTKKASSNGQREFSNPAFGMQSREEPYGKYEGDSTFA
jgi:hypothetical protein